MKIGYKHMIQGAPGPTAPVLTAGVSSATNIVDTEATLNSTDTFADGGSPITDTGVVVYPQGSDENDAGAITVSGSLPIDVSGLTASTNYCFKPYATNVNGTTYGTEHCFQTLYDPFIMTVNVADPSQPQSIGYRVGTLTSVDWGDGTVNTDTTHTYVAAGDYDISILADDLHLHVGSIATDIKQWGDVSWSSMNNMFESSSIETWTATDAPDLSNVTNMLSMFHNATSFNQNINHWDVSNVTNMRSMFHTASSFNQPLDNWDVGNVTSMDGMFTFATSFNQNINNWDTSNVTNMSYMFRNATSFNKTINDWDVSSVRQMDSMFTNAHAFNQPLNQWDTSSVTNMKYMFTYAYAFNQPLNQWDVSSVTNMKAMFHSAYAFNQPLNQWDTSSVTNMNNTFGTTHVFNQPLDNWDVSNVTDMKYMFSGASNFDQDISNRCVTNIPSKPTLFDKNSGFQNQSALQPQWGTCP